MIDVQIQFNKKDLAIGKDNNTNQWKMPKIKEIFDFETTLETKIFCLLLGAAQKRNNIINKSIKNKEKIIYKTQFTYSLKKMGVKHIFASLKRNKKSYVKALINLVDNNIVKLIDINENEFTVEISEDYLNFEKGESYVINYKKIMSCHSNNKIKAVILTDFYTKFKFHTRFLAEFFNLKFETSADKINSTYVAKVHLSDSEFCQKAKYHNGKRKGDNQFYIEVIRIPRESIEIKEKIEHKLFTMIKQTPSVSTKKAVNQRKQDLLKMLDECKNVETLLKMIGEEDLLNS